MTLFFFFSIVPCIRRARQMEYTEDDDQETQVKDENDEGDDWMYTHSTRGKSAAAAVKGKISSIKSFCTQ